MAEVKTSKFPFVIPRRLRFHDENKGLENTTVFQIYTIKETCADQHTLKGDSTHVKREYRSCHHGTMLGFTFMMILDAALG